MQAMACVRRAGLASIRRAVSTIQLRPQQWDSALPDWPQNLDSMSLETFQNGNSFPPQELILSHKFYSSDASATLQIHEETQVDSSATLQIHEETQVDSSEDESPELQALNREQEKTTIPELIKTDETPEKKKWELGDAANKICRVLERGDKDMEEALTQLGVQLTPRLAKMVLDKTFSPSSILRFLQWAKAQPGFEDNGSTYDETDKIPEKKRRKLVDTRREISRVVEKGDEEMEATLTQLRVKVTPQLVNNVFDKISSPSLALRFFQWAKLQPGFKHATSNHDRLTDIVGHSKDFEALRRVLSERSAVACDYSAKTFSFATAWHDDPDMLNEVMELFEKMEFSLRRNAYEMLIAALCQKNHVNAALVALEKMASADCAPRMQTYRPLIQVYCQNNQMAKVQEVFEMMKDCTQDSICYHIVLGALCYRKQFAEAAECLQRMVKMGCKPDSITYNILIRATCNSERIQSALQLFDRMKEEGVTPLYFTYRHILNGLFQIRGFDGAHSFLIQHSGKDHKLDASNYEYLVKVCSESGQEQRASILRMEMKAKGLEMKTK